MKSKLSFIFLVLCALLALTACQTSQAPDPELAEPPAEATEPEAPAAPVDPDEPEPEPAPELSERDQGWVDDINYLREQYKVKHIAPFYWCSEEEFDWKLDQLAAKVGELSDNDIYFELSAIIAGMGDNHTYLSRPTSGPLADIYDKMFPVVLGRAEGKSYLYAYCEDYEQFEPYLWHEIVAVNGVDIAYIQRKFDDFFSPYNPWGGWWFVQNYFVPAFLDWVGCDYKEGYTIQFLNDNREVESVELPVLTYDELAEEKWVDPGHAKTRSGGNWAEYIQEDGGDCIYVPFSDMRALDELGAADVDYYLNLAKETNALIAAHPDCKKLAIDLRGNRGGYVAANTYMYELEAPSVEQTYVLVGPYTMSAAMSCIAIAREELNAVMVGIPTGQFTEFFSYIARQSFDLPFSGIKVQFSSRQTYGPPIAEVQYDENGKLYEWENTILPDVYVEQTFEDSREGRDTAIEWVLAQ